MAATTYTRLTSEQKHRILEQKLLELEAEHFRLSNEIKLAGAAGIENEQVEAANQQVEMLELQLHLVSEDLDQHSDGEAPKPIKATRRTNGNRNS